MGTTIYHPGIGDFKSFWWPDPYSEVMCVRTHTFVSQNEKFVNNFLTQHILSGKSEEINWCEFYFSVNYTQKEMLYHLKFDIRLSDAIILP
jgi:hypothetical protein